MDEFIPLHKLIAKKREQMTLDEMKVVAIHRLASDLNQHANIWQRSTGLTPEQRRTAKQVERQSQEATQLAVTAALEYYLKHNKLEAAYDDIRKVAMEHWNKKEPGRWAEYFAQALAFHHNQGNVDVTQFSREFASRIDRDIQSSLLASKLTRMARKSPGKGRDTERELEQMRQGAKIERIIRESNPWKRPRERSKSAPN